MGTVRSVFQFLTDLLGRGTPAAGKVPILPALQKLTLASTVHERIVTFVPFFGPTSGGMHGD